MEDSAATVAASLAKLLPVLGLRSTGPVPEVLKDTPGQMVLLHTLALVHTATVSELAKRTGVTTATTSAMVRKLVERRLVERMK